MIKIKIDYQLLKKMNNKLQKNQMLIKIVFNLYNNKINKLIIKILKMNKQLCYNNYNLKNIKQIYQYSHIPKHINN